MALDQTHIAGFAARLRERSAQLKDEIRVTLARSNDETHAQIAERGGDEGDDSFSDLIVDLNLAEVERDVGELRAIDRALRRIEEGSFGACIDCGQPIAPARLEAEPSAGRCLRCQQAYERTHASPNTPTM
jgi:DnaK suppressor protein